LNEIVTICFCYKKVGAHQKVLVLFQIFWNKYKRFASAKKKDGKYQKVLVLFQKFWNK
jgi:hypothetical protein